MCRNCILIACFTLFQWLELHLDHNVPTSLLLLSRAMYLPEQTDTSEALKATLSTLPEAVVSDCDHMISSGHVITTG